jgi:RNA polymerase sigma-70 factor, ECF subfamily
LSTGLPGLGQYPPVTSSVARLEIAMPPSRPADSGAAALVLPPFAEIYDEHFDLVWRTARRLGVPEASADDVVQDVFLVLHRKVGEYDGRTPVKRWILGMTVRVVADHRRRYRRKDAPCVPAPADSNGDIVLASNARAPSVDLEIDEQMRLLEQLLSQLSEEKREVLVLAELEEMTVPEIAEMLGANVNTIYARLRTARQEFERLYARHQRRTP